MIYLYVRGRSRVSFSPCFIKSPFLSLDNERFVKALSSAQTRLENRTTDSKLDYVAKNYRRLQVVLELDDLMTHRKRGPFVSLQLMSRWKRMVALNVEMGRFVHKYPHVFEVFVHPVRKNLCCRITKTFRDLIKEENKVMRESVNESITRVKKLLMMSKKWSLPVHALSLIRRQMGLPKDFKTSILEKYQDCFRLGEDGTVELVQFDHDLGIAKVEEWRKKEYEEKWLSEAETKYAFPINYPTGYKLQAGYREQMKNWQRLSYVKPYEPNNHPKKNTPSGLKRYEKRVVALIHEFLNLTVEKKLEVERFAHFRDLGLDVNVRELLLEHPGIFYISTKGRNHVVFLRDGYYKGCLVESNQIHSVRQNMIQSLLLGLRCTRTLSAVETI